jgi:hypothetical protein
VDVKALLCIKENVPADFDVEILTEAFFPDRDLADVRSQWDLLPAVGRTRKQPEAGETGVTASNGPPQEYDGNTTFQTALMAPRQPTNLMVPRRPLNSIAPRKPNNPMPFTPRLSYYTQTMSPMAGDPNECKPPGDSLMRRRNDPVSDRPIQGTNPGMHSSTAVGADLQPPYPFNPGMNNSMCPAHTIPGGTNTNPSFNLKALRAPNQAVYHDPSPNPNYPFAFERLNRLAHIDRQIDLSQPLDANTMPYFGFNTGGNMTPYPTNSFTDVEGEDVDWDEFANNQSSDRNENGGSQDDQSVSDWQDGPS